MIHQFGILLLWIFLISNRVTPSGSSGPAINIFQEFNSTKVRFLLWTRSNGEDAGFYSLKNNDSVDLQESPFNGSKKTYFIFHGFNDGPTQQWILISKKNILSVEDSNTIAVDYEDLVVGPDINYPNAIQMMHEVGEYTASFIDWLTSQTPLTTSQIHMFGHSLGAHTAGMTAKNVKSGIVGRVSGLDPAGPLFESEVADRRLDRSHAQFVDIIHTNACLFPPQTCRGILKAIGHVDFYPNGGLVQSGCHDILGMLVNQCSHQKVHELWNESILPTNPKFTSFPCQNGWNFFFGFCDSCGQGCLDMGFYLDTSLRGTYYLSTRSSPPYAISI